MKVVKGDLLKLAKEGKFDAIVHGCNCFCTMGAGIADQVRVQFPAAYQADKKTALGSKGKLGHCQYVRVSPTLIVVNAYTQFQPGKNFDYMAFAKCLYDIKLNLSGKRIGFPQIGCGIAGGDWNQVASMIDRHLYNEDVTYVEYDA
jgi:O-acetyl-ADP-ribose deacetylase (regulator of RNase III)